MGHGIKLGQVYSNPFVKAFKPQVTEETHDHEVGMANGQLDYIIKSATELKGKLGNDEKEIPGWIQDHISKAHSYIHQANSGYHELGETKSVNEATNISFSSQDLITKLTPKVEKLVKNLKKSYPTAKIDINRNRYETDGSYTLSVSYKGDESTIKKIESDIEKMKKYFTESVNEGILTTTAIVATALLLFKILGWDIKKVANDDKINTKLPKEQLKKLADETIKLYLTNSTANKKVDTDDVIAVKEYLDKEINSGKITTVKQIIQIVNRVSDIIKNPNSNTKNTVTKSASDDYWSKKRRKRGFGNFIEEENGSTKLTTLISKNKQPTLTSIDMINESTPLEKNLVKKLSATIKKKKSQIGYRKYII